MRAFLYTHFWLYLKLREFFVFGNFLLSKHINFIVFIWKKKRVLHNLCIWQILGPILCVICLIAGIFWTMFFCWILIAIMGNRIWFFVCSVKGNVLILDGFWRPADIRMIYDFLITFLVIEFEMNLKAIWDKSCDPDSLKNLFKVYL